MSKKNILIVDDDVDAVEILTKKLSSAGYATLNAGQGREAIDKARENLPDLIVMDIVMPDLDGADVVAELQKNDKTKDIPIIFLSGIITKLDEQNKEITIADRSFPAMAKPCRPSDVIKKIEEILS